MSNLTELKIVAVDFRDWCNEKQQSYLRNGFQDLSSEELWDRYINQVYETTNETKTVVV